MRIIRSIGTMRRLSQTWRREGARIAFVPTMGYLHDGHLSLIRKGRQLAGRAGCVVASIYVNPTQFAPTEDLAKYPRDLDRDRQLCRAAGVDVLLVPTDAEMYPSTPGQAFSTFVVEERLSRAMEGASRPAHFRGVTTVVAKLFHLVQPDWAIFGQKDFQQARIVQQMVRDLDFHLRVVVAPTVREKDGLAMSSRNKFLSSDERRQAVVLWKAIQMARATVREVGQTVQAATLRQTLTRWIERAPAARVDYISFFDPVSLEPVDLPGRGTQMALAVFVGQTRLIDNARL